MNRKKLLRNLYLKVNLNNNPSRKQNLNRNLRSPKYSMTANTALNAMKRTKMFVL